MERTVFLQKIQTFIEQKSLFSKDDLILVGVSGGADSMTLVQSLYELGYSVAIAHCNFCLRGEESDGDQKFVEDYATKRSIPIHVTSFDTINYANEHKISIEMAARELRYSWFSMVMKIGGYTKLAIAHNQNDGIETFFINLLRSSGIKGLMGIPVKNGVIVRPLLIVSRAEIEEFSRQSELLYRVDSTNITNDYLRNKIRNIILPEFESISQGSLEAMADSIEHVQQAYAVYRHSVEEKKRICCRATPKGFVIDETLLLQYDFAPTLLHEFLYPYGFNPNVISQIFDCIGTQAGKMFESDRYVVLHDRDCLIVEEKQLREQDCVLITEDIAEYQLKKSVLRYVTCSRDTFVLDKRRSVASLDLEKLKFPLSLRAWRAGDSFVPYGMNGRKKVSDFLIDEKVPLLKKQGVLVLESNGEIVWVVGYRVSQLFAVTESTKKIVTFDIESLL